MISLLEGRFLVRDCGHDRSARGTVYNSGMSLIDQIQQDITAAMKAREEQRLSTLRMVKSALKNREIEKMAPLDEKESQAVLSTLIKQRKESVEQFTKGGRQEMADKEAAEIVLIESYLPKAAGEDEIVAGVKTVIAEMGSPTMKDMGAVMKNAMARFNGAGMRVDGKVVSDAVKRELAGK
ncbi:MAG: GatB/YqeY domain-containing protein [Candidatus Sulfotelmatobacter sp.]